MIQKPYFASLLIQKQHVMKKLFNLLMVAIVVTIVLVSCKQKPQQPCLPAFIHTKYSDTLAAINHNINFDTAKAYIKKFLAYKKDVQSGKIKDSLSYLTPRYETFNRDAFYDVINRDSIVGVRVFYGINSNKKVVHILFGVKPNGQVSVVGMKEMGQNPPTNSSDTAMVNLDNDLLGIENPE